ncbi:MAG: OmpA family protein [Hydrogenothermaceae bacterium]|nr:OmpA family protein [Hydrogenothermaceae bacterium]
MVFQSNWKLSAARSASVVRFLIEQGLEPKIFTAVGYTDTRL